MSFQLCLHFGPFETSMAVHVFLKARLQDPEQFFHLFWRYLLHERSNWLLRANSKPNLTGHEQDNLAYQSRAKSGQAISAKPYRNSNQSEDDAGIHAISGKHQHRNEDVASAAGILLHFRSRFVNVTENRNREDKVNPAKNGTFGHAIHDGVCKQNAVICRGKTNALTSEDEVNAS